MDARQELEELRRIDELERKQAASVAPKVPLGSGTHGMDTLVQPGLMAKAGGVLRKAIPNSVLEGLSGASQTVRNVFGEENIPTYGDPESAATTVGRLADPASLLLGVKGFQVASNLPKVAKLGKTLKNMAGGAGAGAAASVPLAGRQAWDDDTESALRTLGVGTGTGAMAGPIIGGAGKLVDYGVRGIQNITGGAAGRAVKELRQVFGDRTNDVVNALRNLKGYLPGEAPTAGKAASAQFPELKVLEEAARTRPGANRFLQRDISDEAARMAPLERIIEHGRSVPAQQGGKIPLSPAQASRQNVTRPMYAKAGEQQLPVTDELSALLQGPEIQAAVGRADKSVGQAVTNALAGGKTPPVVGTPGNVTRGYDLPEWSVAGPRTPDVITPPTLSVDTLHRLKSQLDSDISKTVDPLMKSQLETARNQLNGILRSGSGDYAAAQNMFKTMSQPQNQADVAQIMANALRTPGGAEREAAFLQSVRNAPGTVKRSGVPRFESLEQVFSPTQMGEVNALSNSLRREAGYSSLKAPQGIVPEFMSPLEKAAKMTPGVFSQVATAFRSVMSQLGRQSDEKVQSIIDDAMLDPQKMANLIDSIPPEMRNEAINKVRQLLGSPAVLGGTVGQTAGQKEQ